MIQVIPMMTVVVVVVDVAVTVCIDGTGTVMTHGGGECDLCHSNRLFIQVRHDRTNDGVMHRQNTAAGVGKDRVVHSMHHHHHVRIVAEVALLWRRLFLVMPPGIHRYLLYICIYVYVRVLEGSVSNIDNNNKIGGFSKVRFVR